MPRLVAALHFRVAPHIASPPAPATAAAGADLALLPWIDLHNHREHADAPQGCAALCRRRTLRRATPAPDGQLAGPFAPRLSWARRCCRRLLPQVYDGCWAGVRCHLQPAPRRGAGGGGGSRGVHHLYGWCARVWGGEDGPCRAGGVGLVLALMPEGRLAGPEALAGPERRKLAPTVRRAPLLCPACRRVRQEPAAPLFELWFCAL